SITSLSTSTSTAIEAAKTHYYSVNDGGTQQANYDNKGAVGVNSLAAGVAASAAGTSSVAVGDSANAKANGAVAIGQNAAANNAGDVALGSGSVTSAPNPTPTGTVGGTTHTFAGGNPTSVVSVGSQGGERQVTNVAAGRITADSTDAINGSQLFATNSTLDSLSTTVSSSSGEIASLSTGLSSTNSTVASLSTSTS
ncbi:putative membrane-anchored cell surface protein, partial [Burkholderia sp. TJI49]